MSEEQVYAGGFQRVIQVVWPARFSSDVGVQFGVQCGLLAGLQPVLQGLAGQGGGGLARAAGFRHQGRVQRFW